MNLSLRSNNDNKKETSIIVSLTNSLRLLTYLGYLLDIRNLNFGNSNIDRVISRRRGRLIKDFLPFIAKYGKKNFFRGKLKKLLVELVTSNHFTELFQVTKSVCNPDSYANCPTILRELIEISNARLYFLSQRTEHFEDFTTACY